MSVSTLKTHHSVLNFLLTATSRIDRIPKVNGHDPASGMDVAVTVISSYPNKFGLVTVFPANACENFVNLKLPSI